MIACNFEWQQALPDLLRVCLAFVLVLPLGWQPLPVSGREAHSARRSLCGASLISPEKIKNGHYHAGSYHDPAQRGRFNSPRQLAAQHSADQC